MFAGAPFFEVMQHAPRGRGPRSRGLRPLGRYQEPICAGLIAGAALVGIADILVKVFLL